MFTRRRTSRLGLGNGRRDRPEGSCDTSAPTNRIAAAPVGRLSRWDVVNTETLGEIHNNSRRQNMIGEILLGIFGNTIYDLIKSSLKDSLIDRDEDLIGRIHSTIEEASKQFFLKYGDQFGEPDSSFLARQSNIETIVKSMFYGNNFELATALSSKGFDGAKEVDQEALFFFTSKLFDSMMKDFRLNKIITEKKHIQESKETSNKILELLNNLVQEKQNETNPKQENFDGWTIRDAFGNGINKLMLYITIMVNFNK